MFSRKEKERIATEIEKLLLDLNHPEMPKEKPEFILRVLGKNEWSWAVIEPNWQFENKEPKTTLWNENARKILDGDFDTETS